MPTLKIVYLFTFLKYFCNILLFYFLRIIYFYLPLYLARGRVAGTYHTKFYRKYLSLSSLLNPRKRSVSVFVPVFLRLPQKGNNTGSSKKIWRSKSHVRKQDIKK